MDSRHFRAVGTHRYGDASTVPTNSKLSSKSDLSFSDGGSGFRDPLNGGMGLGRKPCEVGRVERMRCWLRRGTWKTAQPRGT